MLEDEQNLVKKLQDGEVQAFDPLYNHYLPKIFRFVLIKVGQREEAEDLTHQAFLKAWQKIDQYEPKGYSFGSWLYRIARNTVYDYYRKPGRETNKVDLETLDQISVLDENQELALDQKMELAEIVSALKKIKEIEKETLILRFVDDLSLKETAQVLGKSEGAVKLIQYRAVKNLKKVLEKND
ncbi:MAG TPA: sigma-70 family RNA polymerase sigma factor [Candidatus Tyrphobacter sp.]|nr:sigma-70 family RNA polymerase sigma factor [Candidatus Tyrphobacter sp.]